MAQMNEELGPVEGLESAYDGNNTNCPLSGCDNANISPISSSDVSNKEMEISTDILASDKEPITGQESAESCKKYSSTAC